MMVGLSHSLWQGFTWFRIYSNKYYWFSTYYPEQTKAIKQQAKVISALTQACADHVEAVTLYHLL